MIWSIAVCNVARNESWIRSPKQCVLSSELKNEIASYAPIVKKIINTAVNGSFKGQTYKELASFVDKFGHRLTGSKNLEDSIDYMINKLKNEDLDNVHGEEVKVPHWIRGTESAILISPLNKSLSILSLGKSVGTPVGGILAQVLVVKTFEELHHRASEAKGKIVVFNQDYITYHLSVQYRYRGAVEAAKFGAVASLIRSVTPFSLNTPHTGVQFYADNVTKIPAVCITLEDANLLQRLQDNNETIKIWLKMEAETLPDTISRNVVSEIQGTLNPQKVVIISGHIDSWDVGNGAMDDGGGVFITWGALSLLKNLGLKPRRTIRAVYWTGEELGLIGAREYKRVHENETNNFNFIMESDGGTFNPLGLIYTAGEMGGCIVEEITKLLAPINATRTEKRLAVGSDISIWTAHGVPGAALYNENDKYFWYHHSDADTLDVEDPDTLDKNTALWASVAYVIADLSIDFPQET